MLSPNHRKFCIAGSSVNVAYALQGAGVSNAKLVITTGEDGDSEIIRSQLATKGFDVFTLPWREVTNSTYNIIGNGDPQQFCLKGPYLPEKIRCESTKIVNQVAQLRPRYRVATGVQIPDASIILTMFGDVSDEDGNPIRSANVLNPGISLLQKFDDPTESLHQHTLLTNLLRRSQLLALNIWELKLLKQRLNVESAEEIREFGPKDPPLEILVTRSERGAVFYPNSGEVIPVNAHRAVKVVDPVGAGDCFLGFLLAMLLQGESTTRSLEIAAAASALAVGRLGGSNVPNMKEVQAFL